MNHRRVIFALIVLTGILVITALNSQAASSNNLQVSFINVGQGDSALIRDPSGFDVLIDGGKSAAGPTVVAFLREQGVDDIDVMVASHADSDHVGGLIDVLEMADIPVVEILYNGYPGDTNTWDEFVAAVADEGITLSAAQFPQSFTWGETTAYILNPAAGLINPETNDASIVILLDHGDIEFLFTGDIDESIEATVVARQTPIAAEILKVAHHGSSYGSSEAFLAAVQPEQAVISVGNNSYGHPAEDTISRLMAAGADVLRTDILGTIPIESDSQNHYVFAVIQDDGKVFLPIILRPFEQVSPPPTEPTATLTPTPTLTPSVGPTATQIPTPTPGIATATEEPGNTGNVVITNIFYDGDGSNEPDEYVEIRNDDTKSIQLSGWTLSDEANHVFTFPSFLMESGKVCRIYTNENHPEWCGFSYGSGSAIWNNSGDTAYLRDATNTLVDEYAYY